MKPEKLFTVLFVCMGILFAMMYGVFELGGWEMGKFEKRYFGAIIIAFVIVVVLLILFYIYECFQCDGNDFRIHISDTGAIEMQGDLHSFYMLKDEKKDKVPKVMDAVIYCGNDILKKEAFEDMSSLRCLAFAGNAHKIEKNLYKTLLENNVNIICNDNTLIIVDNDKTFFIQVFQRAEQNEQQKCVVTGEVNLSVHAK